MKLSDNIFFYLQDGALDLLRELKNIKMSLETLQVGSLNLTSNF